MKPSRLSDNALGLECDGPTFKLDYEDTGPGKFEGNANPGLTQRLYEASLDTSWLDAEAGATDGPHGWNGLIGRFILVENSMGFVSSTEYPTTEAAKEAFETVAEATDSYWQDNE